MKSEERKQKFPTTTVTREKPMVIAADVELLVRACWDWNLEVTTTYERVSMTNRILYSAFSGDRPGTFIESTRYRHSNQGLEWNDVEFVVYPVDEDPAHPTVFMLVKSRLAKGRRYDDSQYKIVPFYPEDDEHRMTCIVSYFLALAFLDGIFEDIKKVEEIFRPEHPPVKSHILRIKEEWKGRPVFRRMVQTARGSFPDPKHIITASGHSTMLKDLGRHVGYKGV